VERPAHLSPDQRRQAQERTRQWRQQCHRSQAEMAAEIGVSPATYRSWESSRDDHAGPTRVLTEALNKTLRRLLGNHYADGEAFDVWGWPRDQDMSYQQVTELLRSAGFLIPRPQPSAQPPTQVFWPHRVREANLVHGVFALAAAAATRAGLTVHLLLDDVGLPERKRYQCDELESWIRTWVAFASGDDAKVTVGLFSSVLTDEYLAARAWRALNDYLDNNWVLKFLLASKVVSPLRYRTHSEQSVLELLENDRDSLKAGRLLTPLRNWIVFEAEITRLLRVRSAGGSGTIITLGGDDERDLWEMWDGGCAEGLSARVQHVYLRTMPVPDHTEPWNIPALRAGDSDRHMLAEYLTGSAGPNLIEWLLRSAIRLPAGLNPGFRNSLDPVLRDVDALLRPPATDLSRVVASMASAIAEWFAT
jgi:transcriptional regulator with XRE-family HTH domain